MKKNSALPTKETRIEKIVRNGFEAFDSATGKTKFFIKVRYSGKSTWFEFLKPDARSKEGFSVAFKKGVHVRLRNDGAIRNEILKLMPNS